MPLEGMIISYNAKQRGGYIDVEGYPDIFFALDDLPFGYIPPSLGESVRFDLSSDGYIHAINIHRLNLKVPKGKSVAIKAFKHKVLQRYYAQPSSKQRQILVIALTSLILLLASLSYALFSTYQNYQTKKAEQFKIEQQRAIDQQKSDLGDMEFEGLSDEARRKIDAKVYGTTKERTDTVTAGIDKRNGLLPVGMAKFKCDDRTQCYQMRSYEEALYFHRHCRRAKLDSNANGIPCENEFPKR